MSKHYLQNKLTGTQGQVVGFDANGNAIAQAPPETGYSKAETLTAATAALYGLTSAAVPDDVFAFLGQYAEYYWRKRSVTYNVQMTDVSVNTPNTGDATFSISTEIDTNRGLVNPTTKTFSKTAAGVQELVSYAPCYIKNSSLGGGSTYFLPQGSTYGVSDASKTVDIRNGSIFCLNIQGSPVAKIVNSVTTIFGEWEIVHSANRSAYPDSGIHDGYEYDYLGVPFDKLHRAAQIETGSYVGTNTYGESNKNQISFSFVPKLLYITFARKQIPPSTVTATIHTDNMAHALIPYYVLVEYESINPVSRTIHISSGNASINDYYQLSADFKTFKWWSTQSASNQLNQYASNVEEYHWIAIG